MAFTDNFTDTNGVELQNHTPSGGTAWTLATDGTSYIDIYSNALACRVDGTKSVYICDDVGSANHYVQIKDIGAFQNGLFGIGGLHLCARLVDGNNYIYWYLTGTGSAGSRLAKLVSNVNTDLVTVQGADEDVIKIECDGTNIKFYLDGVQQGPTKTVSDHQTETSTGLTNKAALGNYAVYDDFEAGALAGAGWSHKIYGLDPATIAKINGDAIANIAKVYVG